MKRVSRANISTWCGAAVFIGWMGMGFTVGLSGFFKFALPGILLSLLLIIVLAAPLRRQRLYTLADLFGERFGGRSGIIPLPFSIGVIASGYWRCSIYWVNGCTYDRCNVIYFTGEFQFIEGYLSAINETGCKQ